MSHKSLSVLPALVALAASVIIELVLFKVLLSAQQTTIQEVLAQPFVWLAVHGVAAAVSAFATAYCVKVFAPGTANGVFLLCLFLGMLIPLAGVLGSSAAFLAGFWVVSRNPQEEIYWQFTNNAELPFTTPIGRSVAAFDSRGYVEQLMYSNDNDALYRKVLAARKMKAAMSVGILKKAVQHSDEKIRLTAYQTLDKKVTELNRQIQHLENEAATLKGQQQSNTWLQIASNYWELLTLEKDEPIARKQLLRKAGAAAINAVQTMPSNRNAHFTLGRVFMMQGEPVKASMAFKRSMQLGMPKDKAMPYLAEAAFDNRQFSKVTDLIGSIDDSFKLYPPLHQVAQYWK